VIVFEGGESCAQAPVCGAFGAMAATGFKPRGGMQNGMAKTVAEGVFLRGEHYALCGGKEDKKRVPVLRCFGVRLELRGFLRASRTAPPLQLAHLIEKTATALFTSHSASGSNRGKRLNRKRK
jgi:hypothetical protein